VAGRDFAPAGTFPSVPILDNAASCNPHNQALANAMGRIGQSNIPYDPFYNNSNAAASTALENAGLDPGSAPDMGTWLGEQPLGPGAAVTKRRHLLLTILALCGLRPAASSSSEKPQAVKELEAAIRRELPSGTPRSRVIAFLQEHKVPYHDSKDIAYFKGPRTIWGLLSRAANRLLIVDTILTFEFDTQDKLVSYSSREQLVGP